MTKGIFDAFSSNARDEDKVAAPKIETPAAPPRVGGMHVMPAAPAAAYLPADANERKGIPLCTGVLDYFPLALAEVAKVSKAGNDQHNPGQPLHWNRSKSSDQTDTVLRHLVERGGLDTDGQRHTAKAAWRILAELQIEMEEALGMPISRGSRVK